MPRQTNFKRSDGNDIGDVLTDRDYLYSVYPELDTRGLSLYSWGDNSFGAVGDNSTVARATVRQEFTSSTNWKQISAGTRNEAAIKTDGTLWVWGGNSDGAVGDNTNADRSTPRQEFTSSTNWRQVSCGYRFTAAIKDDGTLWTWGYNLRGQIGDNTNASRSTPRQEITSSTNWRQVSCGDQHMAAIKTNGTLWLWGYGQYGQLGNNNSGGNASRSTPVQEFTSSTNWKQVSAGTLHTSAIKNDGTLWLWGYNLYGELGDNTIAAERSTPRQEFTSSTNWKQVSIGDKLTGAIKTDGTLWVWGDNRYGAVGDNTLAFRSTPRQEITSSTNWKQIGTGTLGISAIKSDGTLWGWGFGQNQIGDNSTFDRSTPRQEFTSSTNWVSVDGGNSRMALKAPQFVE